MQHTVVQERKTREGDTRLRRNLPSNLVKYGKGIYSRNQNSQACRNNITNPPSLVSTNKAALDHLSYSFSFPDFALFTLFALLTLFRLLLLVLLFSLALNFFHLFVRLSLSPSSL